MRALIVSYLLAGLTFAPMAARAAEDTAPGPTPTAAPAMRVGAETAAISFRDSHKQQVSLRIPLALHRGANAYRLYGARPLTLRDFDRRRDMYRDAFIDLAIRSRLTNADNPDFRPLLKQLDTLRAAVPGLPAAPSPPGISGALNRAADAASELARRAATLPGHEHLWALTRTLGLNPLPVEAAQPVVAALQLRALATDDASARLVELGSALDLNNPSLDPALREGYRAARADFDQLRTGLWPAVGTALRQHGGQLTASTVRELLLSHLGSWAIFGYAGWQSAESALNAEYSGQYAICLATTACELENAVRKTPGIGPQVVYAEFALDYQLTEVLKGGQVGGLQPAGGRTAGSWQVQLAARLEELRKGLEPIAPAMPPAPVVSGNASAP